jgi:adenine-specific DNA-methyltransferase
MNKLDGQSMNIVNENIEKLKEIFPEVFSEDKIDFEKLQEELGNFTDTSNERYNFTWNGKQEAKKIAQTPSTGTLRPCEEESKDWNTTQNLYIEGDNLEVLKLLQKSYHKKVKMIYIDPPYNTGKDFVYKDNFKDNIKNYLQVTGQVDSDGNRLSTNSDTSGRYHSDWLSMMYPRLKLARNLLKDDGVIFISIDDNEVANLRKLCDEIFGEDNFIADLIWTNSEGGGGSDSSNFRIKHEHILSYAKNINLIEILGIEISNRERYTQTDEFKDIRGPYYLQKLGMGSIQYSNSLDYEIKTPDDCVVTPKDNNNGKKACWRWSQTKYKWGLENGFIEIKKDSKNIWTVYTKQYLNADNEGNIITRTQRPFGVINKFSSTQASKFLDSINLKYFNYAKPNQLIEYLIARLSLNSDIILDFFSGSGTTAHAVMKLNSENNDNRKYICVQIPEETDEKSEAFKAGYKNICEIGKERIRRAGEKILEDNQDKDLSNLDIGFKVFKLDSSNIKEWDSDFDTLEQDLLDGVENIKKERSSEDLLYEILLKYGLDLTLPIEEKIIDDKKVFVIGFGALVVCLDDSISIEVVEDIAKLKEEYESETMRVVFKDSSFKDAIVKTNAIQVLKQFGIDEVVSV